MIRTIQETPVPASDPVGQAGAGISAQLAAASGKARSGDSLSVRVTRIIVYGIAVLLPLLYLPVANNVLERNKQEFLIIAVSVGLVLYLLNSVINGKMMLRITPLDKGVLALILASLVATIFSLTPVKSVFSLNAGAGPALLTVLALGIFYFLAVNSFHDHGKMLRQVLLIALTVAFLLGVLQMFGLYILPGDMTHTRGFNTVGTLNALGILAAIALPLFTKTIERGTGKALRFLAAPGLILGISIIVFLNWWVLWAVALVGMLAMIAFDSLNTAQRQFSLSRFVVPVIIIVVGAFILLMHINIFPGKNNLPVEVSPSYRLSWSVTQQVLKDRPVTGFGPENFSLAFDRWGAKELAGTRLSGAKFYTATSEVLTMIVSGGIVAILALLILFWCLAQAIATFSGMISESMSERSAAFAAQSSGTLAAMLAAVAALFLYPFGLALWGIFFTLLILTALIIAGDRSRTVDIEERPLYSLAASLGFIAGLILVLTGIYLTSVRYVAAVEHAHALRQTDSSKVIEGVTHAVNLDPRNDQYLRNASQVVLVMIREELNKTDANGERAQRVQNLIASAVQFAQRATEVHPEESLNWSNLGQTYQALAGLVDNVSQLSQAAYEHAAELRPGDPTFDNNIGQMWLAWSDLLRSLISQSANAATLQQQRIEALGHAEEFFKKAIDTSETYGLAIYNLGAVYERQGRVREAITQLEKIAPYNANEPTLMFELGLLYVRNQQKSNAIAALQRAVLLAPQYSNARWYLALLLEDRGDIDAALVQLRKIQETNSENTELQEKIHQLETGDRQIPPEKIIDTKPIQ